MQRAKPLLAIALCAAPLVAAAQVHVSKSASPVASAAAPSPVAADRAAARGNRSLMGMVMAALIDSAEQSARNRAAPQALPANADAGASSAQPRTDTGPARATAPAIEEQVAVQGQPGDA
jgi:hypothetical protein